MRRMPAWRNEFVSLMAVLGRVARLNKFTSLDWLLFELLDIRTQNSECIEGGLERYCKQSAIFIFVGAHRARQNTAQRWRRAIAACAVSGSCGKEHFAWLGDMLLNENLTETN